MKPGSYLGPYEIVAKLGEGGMGEVWRATDPRLRREVAIKVLPAAFAGDTDRLSRFEREARLLAALNHPGIAHVYGFERTVLPDGSTGNLLVMELVDGEDLSERLKRGPLRLAEALEIAAGVAGALEEAHEKGVVHRDLKPANVKLTAGGAPKVLDFGLAKAWEEATQDVDASLSPTITQHHTRAGTVLGTAAYMAPEQARGQPVDRRADIWSFGVVLYEMLTGKRLFTGENVADVSASVLTREVDLADLPPGTPAPVRQLLRRCLERQPRVRLRDIGDARIVLEEALAGKDDDSAVGAPRAAEARRGRRWLGGLAALAAGAAVVGLLDRTVLAPAPTAPPTIVPLTYSGLDSSPDVSPDGKTVTFSSYRDGRWQVWLKQLSTGEEVPLTAGSDLVPRISPDGGSIVFARAEPPGFGIYRVSVLGGDVRRLVRDGLLPIWSPDGRSVAFVRSLTEGAADSLMTVPADGGPERELARIKGARLQAIAWSPDGAKIAARTIGRLNFAAVQELLTVDVASGAVRTVMRFPGGSIGSGVAWAGHDALLTAYGASQATKGPFRLIRVPLSGGRPRALISLTSLPQSIALAGPGRVVVDAPEQRSNMRLVDLPVGRGSAGQWLSRGASVDRQPTFSPDGRSLAFTSDRGGSLDVWELSLDSLRLRRLTLDGADDWDPCISPDGKRLLWSSNRSGHFEIWGADADGGGARQLSDDGTDAENPTMTLDGSWIVYASSRPGGNGIWKMRPDGSDAQRILAGSFTAPEVSPDGRWVATADVDTLAQTEGVVRVVRVADGSEVTRLRVHTGSFAVRLFIITVGRSRWMPDGHTLVFLGATPEDPSVYALFAQTIVPAVDTGASRRVLYRGDRASQVESFGIAPDGRRLVVALREQRSDLWLIEGLPGTGER